MSRKPKWQRELDQKFRAFRKELRTRAWTEDNKAIYLKLARLRLIDESARSYRCPKVNDLNAIRFEIKYTEEQLRSTYRKMPDYEIKHMISELKKMELEIIAKEGHNKADQEPGV